MDATTEKLVKALRERLANMKADDRVELVNTLMYGYCVHCGDPQDYESPDWHGCYCRDDS